MIQLTGRLKTGLKIGIAAALTLFVVAHTSLFNHYMQRKEARLWHLVSGYFKATPTTKVHKISFHLAADIAVLQQLITAATNLCNARGLQLSVKKFYHNQDLALLKGQIEESIDWGTEAIISIGSLSAQNIHTILTKRDIKVPHIFSCIANPMELGISTGKYHTGTHSTGIAEDSSGITDAFFKSFLHVRPDAKKVIILHSLTAPGLRSMIAEMINGFASRSIQAAGVYVSTMEEVARAATNTITRDIDAVIVLRDTLVVSSLQPILKACRAHGTTAFVSDSNSVVNGAVAGCCVEEAELGLLVGEIITKIVLDGIAPEEIPVTYFNTASLCRTYVNQYEMHAQGLHNRKIYDLMTGEGKLEFLRTPPKKIVD